MKEYQQCKRCVMDNSSDPKIIFDQDGFCNYCADALQRKPLEYFPNAEGKEKLEALLKRVKALHEHKPYDCIMGISGGLDSSYLAYLGAVKWNLRILAVHVDDGYDSEITKSNIKNLCEKANIHLEVIKPDTKQFNELTRAYVFAGVPNLAVPQDNVLFATLYNFVKRNNIKVFLSGANFALESILQEGNSYSAYDVRNIKDINKRFGRDSLNKIHLISYANRDFNEYLYKIQTLIPLNYIDYNRDRATKELHDFCGFAYYGSKHLENNLTKFIQTYWFYHKFGVDKRTSHLSSMIVSDQLSREEALALLREPIYDDISMQENISHIIKNLDISNEEFTHIMNLPGHMHEEFKTSRYWRFKQKIKPVLKKIISKS